jgi:hypothetical protein
MGGWGTTDGTGEPDTAGWAAGTRVSAGGAREVGAPGREGAESQRAQIRQSWPPRCSPGASGWGPKEEAAEVRGVGDSPTP